MSRYSISEGGNTARVSRDGVTLANFYQPTAADTNASDLARAFVAGIVDTDAAHARGVAEERARWEGAKEGAYVTRHPAEFRARVPAYLRATANGIDACCDGGMPHAAHVEAAARCKVLTDAADELDSMEPKKRKATT